MKSRFLALLALIGLLASFGCGDSSSSGSTLPSEEAALRDLGNMLKSISEEKKKTPMKAADLDVYEPIFMSACRGITANKIVYIWGSGYAADKKEIVAHETTTESAGGYVLLQDGTVKKMTADEFKSAPKAAKK
jgi:hypothetical protein